MGTGPRDGEVVMLRIHVRHPGRAAAFYASLFGWTVGPVSGGIQVFRTPGGLRGVFRRGEPSTAGPEIYVGVSDLEGALRRAVALGGVTLVRPGPGPAGGRVALVLDPEGNRIGLLDGDVIAEGDPVFPPGPDG